MNSLGVSAPSLWGLEIGEECCNADDKDLDKEWDVEDSPLTLTGEPDDIDGEDTNDEGNGHPEGDDGTDLAEVWGDQNANEEEGGESLEPFSSFGLSILAWNEGEKNAVYQNVHSHEVEHLEELVLRLADWVKKVVEESDGDTDEDAESGNEHEVIVVGLIKIVLLVLSNDQAAFNQEVECKAEV